MAERRRRLLNSMPYDKSVVIRYLMLDLSLSNRNGTDLFLKETAGTSLSPDIQAAINATLSWHNSKVIHVGESGTLLRFLKYYDWYTRSNKEFVLSGTLQHRTISNDREKILKMPLKKLLTLDNQTSQWASAAYLFRPTKPNLPSNAPFKLLVTKRAYDDYTNEIFKYNRWVAPVDSTIYYQAMAALNASVSNTTVVCCYARHSEDYCFARVFNRATVEEGRTRFPSLVNHESNRLVEVDTAKQHFVNTGVIDSNDHRIVQALVMYAKINRLQFTCVNSTCVTKSWPKFWEFAELL